MPDVVPILSPYILPMEKVQDEKSLDEGSHTSEMVGAVLMLLGFDAFTDFSQEEAGSEGQTCGLFPVQYSFGDASCI